MKKLKKDKIITMRLNGIEKKEMEECMEALKCENIPDYFRTLHIQLYPLIKKAKTIKFWKE